MASFLPAVGPEPKVLILGSMPSQISLREQQYYGNPQNAFWWLMAQMLDMPEGLSYSESLVCLNKAGIALWDVLFDCQRSGSLDSNIVRSSEQPNDIRGLLHKYLSINTIAFNGGAAKTIFMRHCADYLQENPAMRWVQLPSTSPAYAGMSRQDKLAIWRSGLMFYDDNGNNEQKTAVLGDKSIARDVS